ncbi:MAG: pyruvate kinase [Acutalibacteraceae bacterium]|nr:pyruvate kinase [Acutalibacteraceae bacterium]
MLRKTKIVCTIGPASSDENTIREMCKAGMNVARLNFSHNTHSDHAERIETIKKVREELNLPIAILLDTKGPEYRIKTFKNDKIFLNAGDKFIFTSEEIEGDETKVSVNYKDLPKEMNKGDKILLNNGLLSFEVEDCTDTEVRTTVLIGGELSNRKSMSFPNKTLKQVYLSEQDKADILFGIRHDIDFLACSFVSCRQDLIDVKEFLKANGDPDVDIIAKIENRSGVDNIEEICEECDGIMIARGDMGVEIPFEELPYIQKMLITKCRLLGKRVITATEMLESMIYNPRPTRAEISDVANAVYDGTSAIMLSGETAAGKYPVESVKTMALIAKSTEDNIHYAKRFLSRDFKIKNTLDAISHATCGMAIDIDAASIVVCSLSGKTARMVSRFRPPMNIIGLTTAEKNWRKLSLSWGVVPVMCENYNSTDVMFYTATQKAKEVLDLRKGERIVLTGGVTNGKSGNTDLIKVESI